MSGVGQDEFPAEFLNLVDDCCSGLIDESGFHRLEAHLLERAEARRHFAEYFHHHTEIHFAVRAGRATEAVLERLATRPVQPRGGREDGDSGPEHAGRAAARRSVDGRCGPAGDGRGSHPLAGVRARPVADHAAGRREAGR